MNQWWKPRAADADPNEDQDDVQMPPAPGASDDADKKAGANKSLAPRQYLTTLPDAWSKEQADAFVRQVDSLKAGDCVLLSRAESEAQSAKVKAHDAAIVQKRETAKKNAVIGMDAAESERFALMVDAAPDGVVLDDICARAQASADAKAPKDGAQRQTTALAPAQLPGATDSDIEAAKAKTPTPPNPNDVYAARRKQQGQK